MKLKAISLFLCFNLFIVANAQNLQLKEQFSDLLRNFCQFNFKKVSAEISPDYFSQLNFSPKNYEDFYQGCYNNPDVKIIASFSEPEIKYSKTRNINGKEYTLISYHITFEINNVNLSPTRFEYVLNSFKSLSQTTIYSSTENQLKIGTEYKAVAIKENNNWKFLFNYTLADQTVASNILPQKIYSELNK